MLKRELERRYPRWLYAVDHWTQDLLSSKEQLWLPALGLHITEAVNSQSQIKEGLMRSYPSYCTIGSWWILWAYQAPRDIPASMVTQMVLIKISGPQKHMDMEKGFGQWKGNNRDVKESRVGGVKVVNVLHACLKSSKTKYIGRAFKDRKYPVKWGSLHTP